MSFARAVLASSLLLQSQLAAAAPTLPSTPLPPEIEAYVARAMREFSVPGLGLAIVKDGRVLLARGFGTTRQGTDTPVDGHTRFGIVSNTKLFTAVAVSLLVEEHKLDWDTPVARYLPWFETWDPYVTREVTLRDLLAHRSGLASGAGDLAWWPGAVCERREAILAMRHLKPTAAFRTQHLYSNTGYIVAGEVIEAVTGQRWEEFVTKRILEPLGMRDTDVRLDTWAHGKDAQPHGVVDGALRPLKHIGGVAPNPAAGISSSAEDMARWLKLLLARGRLDDGTRIFSEATAHEIQTIVTPIRVPPPPSDAVVARSPLRAVAPTYRGYGLGLYVRDYRGNKVLSHNGIWSGFSSYVSLLPELGVGVVVLTNQEEFPAIHAITYRILDHYVGAAEVDWVLALKSEEERKRLAAPTKPGPTPAEATSGASPSLPLPRYAAAYVDPWYGQVDVVHESGKLTMRFRRTPLLAGDMEHVRGDTFAVRWRERELRADAYAHFVLGPDGAIERIAMKAIDPDTDWSYDFQDLDLRPNPPPAARSD